MSGLFHGEFGSASEKSTQTSAGRARMETASSRAYRRMPSGMPRMGAVKRFTDFDPDSK